jgi:hypothetical protein
MSTISPRSGIVTASWFSLNLFPVLIAVVVWLVLGKWGWALALLLLYPLYIIPYGFFVSLPMMVKFFRPALNPRKR